MGAFKAEKKPLLEGQKKMEEEFWQDCHSGEWMEVKKGSKRGKNGEETVGHNGFIEFVLSKRNRRNDFGEIILLC